MASPSTHGSSDPYIDLDDTATGKWTPAQTTMLSSLIATADASADSLASDPVPWRSGHALRIAANGGLYDRQRQHVMIAASKYSSYRAKNLAVNVTQDCNLTVDGNITLLVRQNLPPTSKSTASASGSGSASASSSASGSGSASASGSGSSSSSGSSSDSPSPLDGLEGVAWGDDKLAVTGNADFKVHERMTLLTGINTRYERVWNGAIMRMAGMEGVICAGFYLRIIMPISATISALCTGDVYGGSARASLVRVNLAGLGYRSVEACVWAIGFYYRSTAFTIEPIIGTPTQHQPAKNIFRKIGRLMLALCPFLDLAVGAFSFFYQLLKTPFDLIYAGVRKALGVKKAKPPAGPPRSRVRTMGVCSQGRNLTLVT